VGNIYICGKMFVTSKTNLNYPRICACSQSNLSRSRPPRCKTECTSHGRVSSADHIVISLPCAGSDPTNTDFVPG
jgi:hypothetical protein